MIYHVYLLPHNQGIRSHTILQSVKLDLASVCFLRPMGPCIYLVRGATTISRILFYFWCMAGFSLCAAGNGYVFWIAGSSANNPLKDRRPNFMVYCIVCVWCRGWSNWIKHRKYKYYICWLTGVILKIERDLSNNIWNTLISGVKFSGTTLFSVVPYEMCERFISRRPRPSISQLNPALPYTWRVLITGSILGTSRHRNMRGKIPSSKESLIISTLPTRTTERTTQESLATER